jgi:hypothetical protein
MATRKLDAEIDRLYQLPLDEFTPARNALAKEGGAEIKGLSKPPLAAWAVNQLYWRQRDEYDALIAASDSLRRTHKSVLAGKGGDLRAAGKAHDEALDTALKSTLGLLQESGQTVTDQTRQSIVTTLRALPADDPPGRLTRTLQPGGFEMLAGLSIGGAGRGLPATPPKRTAPRESAPPKKSPKQKAPNTAAAAKAIAKAKDAVSAATRDLRQAEHAAKREEFEAARAVREAEKAERRVTEARAAFESARETLEEAEAELPPATRARESATRRAKQAEETLEAARTALEEAQAQLKGVASGDTQV